MSQQTKKPRPIARALIVIALATIVGIALVANKASKENHEGPSAGLHQLSQDGILQDAKAAAIPEERTDATRLPKLVDLGAGKCVPCKMMAPILDQLKDEYQGKFDVVFIDVWKDKAAGDQLGIRAIPTQIFYDAAGAERFRHEGFYSKADILETWTRLGIQFTGPE